MLADLPGTDPARRHELVLLGAHLDSWAAGTGATDDGAGVVIEMEAMRILKAVGVRPRRTIRLALWTGEEQGALGSLAYVNRHVATIPRATTPAALQVMEFLRRRSGPIVPKTEHTRISAVFTLDAGGARIRGVSVGSRALVPLFQSWIAPLRDLGVTTVSPNSDCGGDCTPFADAGLPIPVFTHDPLDYETRTHHANMDVYEYLHEDDLTQGRDRARLGGVQRCRARRNAPAAAVGQLLRNSPASSFVVRKVRSISDSATPERFPNMRRGATLSLLFAKLLSLLARPPDAWAQETTAATEWYSCRHLSAVRSPCPVSSRQHCPGRRAAKRPRQRVEMGAPRVCR